MKLFVRGFGARTVSVSLENGAQAGRLRTALASLLDIRRDDFWLSHLGKAISDDVELQGKMDFEASLRLRGGAKKGGKARTYKPKYRVKPEASRRDKSDESGSGSGSGSGSDSDEEEEKEKEKEKPAPREKKGGGKVAAAKASTAADEGGDAEEAGAEDAVGDRSEPAIKAMNPNHRAAGGGDGPAKPPPPSRRDREMAAKAAARKRYQALHAAGKTDEARSDLERLRLVRAQREEAAQKKKGAEAQKELEKTLEAERAAQMARAEAGANLSRTQRKKRGG